MTSWGSFVVAAVAFLQFWVIEAWRRFFRQGSVDVHETGLIEIGYSGLGPTIGLHGTLRAVHRDVFVRAMELQVIRQRDRSQHVFEWAAFRGTELLDEVTAELPSGFLVATAQPNRYSIAFSDISTRQAVQQRLSPVQEHWQGALLENLPTSDEERYEVYADFSQTTEHVNAYTEINRLCYWEAGDYVLKMEVLATRPDRSYQRAWNFSISEQDAQLLHLNSLMIVRGACGFSDVPWNFAYAEYKPEASTPLVDTT
jgi:hypothetical protein